MRLRTTPLALTLCLALVAGLGACDDDDEIVRPIAGTVTGTVSADGEPLYGVDLELAPIGMNNSTGTDGTYAFTDVPAGSYTVSIVRAEQDVTFSDSTKAVTVTNDGQDATANFDGSMTTTSSAR